MNTQYEAYQRQYNDTLTHLIEYNKPWLADAVPMDTNIVGTTKVFKFIDQLNYKKKSGRNEIADQNEPDYTARHLTIDTYYTATPIDREDVERMVNDPTSDIYSEAVHAIYRAQSASIFEGFFADVITTETGGSTSSFPGANQVAVNFDAGPFGQNSGTANIGLNIDKIMKVRSLISNANVLPNATSQSMVHAAVCEDDVQQMMANVIGTDNYAVIDTNFRTMHSSFGDAADKMVDGMFRWQGITFHVCPKSYFEIDASGYRRLPFWIYDGVVFGMKHNVMGEIVPLPNTVESVKLQALTRCGFLRKQDTKVYEVKVTA